MEFQLVVVGGPEKGRTIELADGQTCSLGRGDASDVQLKDPRMSRVHCRIEVAGGQAWLSDAGSSHGTFYQGAKVDRMELTPGAEFQLGDTQIRFQSKASADEATLPPAQAFGRPTPPSRTPQLKNLVGQSLAYFRIDAILTAGNSGMVFKAYDTKGERPAAVKVLTPDLTNSDEQKERFVRAMKTMLPIRHDNLVELYNAGKSGPYCWAAMELVDGESLTQVIDRIGIEGMLDWREVWRVSVHIARALDAAYEHKIIHRNVTPTNILRRHSDRACLLGDLMLAKALEGTLAAQITRPGQLIGDIPYMAPERTRDGNLADSRSDIYGLGATCYALLTGRPPFQSSSLPDLVRQVREATPPPPRQFQFAVNELFQDVVLRMLAKQPDDRPQTPGALLRELDRLGKFNNLDADWTDFKG